MLQTWTHGIYIDSWYRHWLMVLTKIHCIDNTHGIDITHGIDLDPWHNIGPPESHTYKRAECCQYAGFFRKKCSWRPLVSYTTIPHCLWSMYDYHQLSTFKYSLCQACGYWWLLVDIRYSQFTSILQNQKCVGAKTINTCGPFLSS